MYHDDPQLHTVPPDRGDPSQQPQWRQDFPIDRAQDNYVARRDFTRFLGVISLAFAVGQFWIAFRKWLRPDPKLHPNQQIVELDALPVGSAVSFRYPTEHDPAVLIRPDEQTLLAYASQCTHLQCPVLPRIQERRLHCPCHAGYFDLETGRPFAGPPRRPLPRILIDVRDGVAFATGIDQNTI